MFEGVSYLQIAVAAVGGYLLGSIPFGVIVMKAAGAGDPRAIGSGNIGRPTCCAPAGVAWRR